jgi:hypothetical protein
MATLKPGIFVLLCTALGLFSHPSIETSPSEDSICARLSLEQTPTSDLKYSTVLKDGEQLLSWAPLISEFDQFGLENYITANPSPNCTVQICSGNGDRKLTSCSLFTSDNVERLLSVRIPIPLQQQ